MAEYRFTNSQSLTYPELGVHADPGDVHDWNTPPADGNWAPVEAKPDTSKRAVPAETKGE